MRDKQLTTRLSVRYRPNRLSLAGCGFNRSMQHTKGCVSGGVANETKTAVPPWKQPIRWRLEGTYRFEVAAKTADWLQSAMRVCRDRVTANEREVPSAPCFPTSNTTTELFVTTRHSRAGTSTWKPEVGLFRINMIVGNDAIDDLPLIARPTLG